MEPLLDSLTLAPAAQLFELDPPHYTSSYGRRTEAIFKHNVPPAPMLLAPDNGLILYERVISTKAEHQLLDKLTKPKYYHPTPTIRKSYKLAGSHASRTTATTTSSAGSQNSNTNAQRRPSSGHSSTHPPSSSVADVGSRSASGASTSVGSSGRDSGGKSFQHRTRSFSAGRIGGGGGGGGLSSAAAGGGGGGGTPMRRKPLYPEDGPLKDYFSKERASVTATTVFTWGNRYKIGDYGSGRGGSGGGGITLPGASGGRGGDGGSGRVSFSAYMPVQQKPPLRL